MAQITSDLYVVEVAAVGGCMFTVHAIPKPGVDELREFLGSVEYGTIDDDGGWDEDPDVSLAEVVRERFGLEDAVTVTETC